MGKQKIVDSNHFVRIQHYRLKKRGKLEKKITIESVYQKALKQSSKLIKVLKGQLIQKCIRKISSKSAENVAATIGSAQNNQLHKLKNINHIYASQLIINELFTNYFNDHIAECINVPGNDLSFLSTASPTTNGKETNNNINHDEMKAIIHEIFIPKNSDNLNEGGLGKLKVFLDDVKEQISTFVEQTNQKLMEAENKNNSSNNNHQRSNTDASTSSRTKVAVTKAMFLDSLDGSAGSHDDVNEGHGDDNGDDDIDRSKSSSVLTADDYHTKVKNRLKSLRNATVDKYKARNNSNNNKRPHKDDGLSSYRPPDANNSGSNNGDVSTTAASDTSQGMRSSSSNDKANNANYTQTQSKNLPHQQSNSYNKKTSSNNSVSLATNTTTNRITHTRKITSTTNINTVNNVIDDEANMHPSWAAKRKRQQTGLIHIHTNSSTSKKIKFDD